MPILVENSIIFFNNKKKKKFNLITQLILFNRGWWNFPLKMWPEYSLRNYGSRRRLPVKNVKEDTLYYRCEGKNSFLTNPHPRFLLSPCSQAIAVTSVINDRRCIKSLDATSLPLSPMMLLSCCPNCCGCSGGNGHVLNAWKFTRDVGLVTGTMNSDNILQPDDVLLLYI